MPHSTDKIFIQTDDDAVYRELLSCSKLSNLQETLVPSEATIVLAAPPRIANQLGSLSQLAWLQSTYAGVNALLAPDLRQDYQLTNVRGVFGPLIAEYVLGYLLNRERHLSDYAAQQAIGLWQPKSYRSLQGQTLLILGTGSIGAHLAKAASVFGMRVIGINRSGIPPKESAFDQVFHECELNHAIAQCDVLVNTLPSTPATRHILNQETLSHASNILLFNVGRGDALCEASLLLALKERWVAHAYLDVFEHEPLPKSHPFWTLSRITITPHIAAVSFPEQVWQQFVENYQRWQQGFELQNQIDFQKGY